MMQIQSAEAGSGFELVGTPASRGTASGHAKVVASASDLTDIRSDEIVVVTEAYPQLLTVCADVAGIVSEFGGPLCTLANQARIRSIPFVCGVPEATRIISDGISISLDGGSGRVTIRPR